MAKMRFNGNITEAAGAVGRLQYRRSAVGQQITERGYSRQPGNAAQLAVQGDFERASASWSLLTPAQKSLWTQAAKAESRRDPVTLKVYSLTNRAYYIGLASKFLQINGVGASIPTAPPVVKFAGDSVSVSLGDTVVGSGTATWVANKANAAGVKTELLAQRLASKDRAPSEDAYVSKGFVAFATGSLSTSVTLGPGVWSLAYRFVSAASGEERPLVPLGTTILGLAVVEGGAGEAPAAPAARKKAA